MKPENITFLFVNAFVDELSRSGVKNVCLCPGSRSTPLAMVLARQSAIKVWMHIDERCAAFFALGLAKISQQPVALVCTSGTAAANFLPAIVEAHYARVPLIVLTADRPPELRDIGAAQTIDQLRIYGTHAKWFTEMPLPDASLELLRYVRAMACRAVATSNASPSGPVHLNFPFREPLVPIPTDELPLEPRPDMLPYTTITSGARIANHSDFEPMLDILRKAEHGLIVCGPAYRYDPAMTAAITGLAETLNFPVLADPLSGVRCGSPHYHNIMDSYDACLRDTAFVERFEPDVVLRFGALPTSKPLLQYLQRHTDARQIVFDSGGAWNDTPLRAQHMIHADEEDTSIVLQTLIEYYEKPAARMEWLTSWREADQRAREAMTTQINAFDEHFEGRVFTELAPLLPDGATVYVSNSMPVRDLDTFLPASSRQIRFLCNRGANGIDGVISSALGASAATVGPVVLVIGDLAFYHDMNGLLAAKLHRLKATIVLVNNDGGGIFSFLPQAAYPEHFEQLYGTPTGLDFRQAAALYGATFTRATDWKIFRTAIQRGLTFDGLTIVEIQTDRERNVQLHRHIWKAVSAALEHVLI